MKTSIPFYKNLLRIALLGFFLAGCASAPQAPQIRSGQEARRSDLDHGAQLALSRLYRTVPGSRQIVQTAKAVLVFPALLAAGSWVGGQYGEGVLLVEDESRGYYQAFIPALQGSAQSKALFLVFNHKKALNQFLKTRDWVVGKSGAVRLPLLNSNSEVVDFNDDEFDLPPLAMLLEPTGLAAEPNLDGLSIQKLGQRSKQAADS